MKKIRYNVTTLGEMEVPENIANEEIKFLILDNYWGNEPNDIEWEEIENDI